MSFTEVIGSVVKSVTVDVSDVKIGYGTSEGTPWEDYAKGVFVTVDTSAAGFTETPVYVVSTGGGGGQWGLIGTSSVYNATKDSFKVYIQKANGDELDVADAAKWYINWIGIGK